MASLQRNTNGQHITFGLVNATTGAALTGATVTVYTSIDNAAQTTAGGTVTEKGHGQYDYTVGAADCNGLSIGFLFTATNAIPVNVQIFTDPFNFPSASIDATGNFAVTSNVKKNAASTGFVFVMTNSLTGLPMTGLSITGQKCIDGTALTSMTNTPTEVGSGIYTVNLSQADTNGNHIIYVFTASGANTLYREIITQP